MKTQTKKMIAALGAVIGVTGGSIAAVSIYGATSESAKGFRIEEDKSRNFAFDSFDALIIDNTGSQDVVVGDYNRESGKNDTVTPRDGSPTIPLKQFIRNFKSKHNNQDPLFKIKTKLFNFDNRYLAAVSPKDWYDFVVWYVGGKDINGNEIPGHLSFGPEAGAVSTFEIISGIEEKQSSITLGQRINIVKEEPKITFYPDAFFGTFPLYSIQSKNTHNRLLTTSINPYDLGYRDRATTQPRLNGYKSKSLSLDEIEGYLDAINAINKHNAEHEAEIAASYHGLPMDPDQTAPFPLDKDGHPTVGAVFGDKWGAHSIHEFKPYYLAKSDIRLNPDGSSEQLYKIYSEYIPWVEDETPNDETDNLSLLETVTKNFPELLTTIDDGAHVIRNADGSFKLVRTGSFKTLLPSDTIGLPQILSSLDSNFDGMGIDFLKYVGIHEYGHHLTLMQGRDVSDGGVVVGDIHIQKPPVMETLHNIDILNGYLAARAPHLRAFNATAFGAEWPTGSDPANVKLNSQFVQYKVCDGVWNQDECKKHTDSTGVESSGTPTTITIEKITGHRRSDGSIIEPCTSKTDGSSITPCTTSTPTYYYGYLGYKSTIQELREALPHIAPGLTIYEAFLLNSLDPISGTLNPGQVTPHSQVIPTTPLGNASRPPIFSQLDTKNNIYPLYNRGEGKWDEVLNILAKLEDSKGGPIFASTNTFKSADIPDTFQPTLIPHPITSPATPPTPVSGTPAPLVTNKCDSDTHLDLNPLFLIDMGDKRCIRYSDTYNSASNRDIHINPDDKTSQILYNIEDSIKEYIKNIALLSSRLYESGIQTPEQIAEQKAEGDPRPQNVLDPRPAYLYSHAEVMTRDFVQMTLAYYANEKPLSNGPAGLNIYQSQSSFEYFVSSRLTEKLGLDRFDPSAWNKFFTERAADVAVGKLFAPLPTAPGQPPTPWTNPTLLSDDEIKGLSQSGRDFYNQLTYSAGANRIGVIFDFRIKNDFLGHTRFVSNGWEKDRQLRLVVDWGLYAPATITDANKGILGNNGDVSNPGIGAHEYWKFIKDSYGVGDRAISGVFREKQSDKVYMFGYMSVKDANKAQFIAFKNRETGETSYIAIRTGEEVSNLFYFEKQSYPSSRHTIEDDGYTGWATEKFGAGMFIGEEVSQGNFEVYFTDSNHNKIDLFKSDNTTPTNNSSEPLSLLGNRNHIAENGKLYTVAPTYFEKANGIASYIVNERFHA